MPTVSYSPLADSPWTVRGVERRPDESGNLALFRDELVQIRMVDLKRALSREAANYGRDSSEASVTDVPEEYFDPEYADGAVEIQLVDSQLYVSVLVWALWPEDGEESQAVARIARLITPLLAQQGGALVSIDYDHDFSGQREIGIRLTVAAPWRGRSAGQFAQVGFDIIQLCNAFSAELVTRDSVADLVRGGGAHLLVGQPEGNWLDAKSQEYDLSTTHGKISLAQSVARFCNGGEGGLIVIGAKAKRVPGGEVIRKVEGVVPRYGGTSSRYLRVLDEHVYPPAASLRVDLIPVDGENALICIDIPPQPEELKPFLVHGAIRSDGVTEGSFISIVQRRGEGSIPITAPMIHSTLAAGRAFLRGNTPP